MSIAPAILGEQRTVLYNVSWETFEALLRETGEDRGSRFAYEDGTLEIMTPLFEHENPKIQFDRLIFSLAEELGVEIKSAGSTTLKKEILKKVSSQMIVTMFKANHWLEVKKIWI